MKIASLNGEDETTKGHGLVLVEFPWRVALSGAFSLTANQKRHQIARDARYGRQPQPFASPTASASGS